jgi:GABA permease
MTATPTLTKALNQRQLRMIAIGGVIGAGLFVGSGVVISDTGPGSFLTYALAGPDHHGHADAGRNGGGQPVDRLVRDYSRNALGNWAGFSVG